MRGLGRLRARTGEHTVDQGPAQACHGHLPLLQQIQFPTFCLSLFSGERLVVGAGKDLAYKRSSDNWKVWARS